MRRRGFIYKIEKEPLTLLKCQLTGAEQAGDGRDKTENQFHFSVTSFALESA